MNKYRRGVLESAAERLEELIDGLEGICNDEQEAYDNLPESLQDSERGEQMSENIDDLEQVTSDLEDIIDVIRNIIDR